ncbi:MAG: peptidoglycan-binding protein [Verrucomicrobia bacterium]|nr:peptidoglycan-binding protein [Verrucomicrobiota bacterium]
MLPPQQIVAGVQAALQERGYYTYAIDGRMGPLTKAAIGRYQSERRLSVSYGIDSATLGSLGVIH